MADVNTSTPARSTALSGLLAGVGGASMWFVAGLPSIILGLLGVALGITTLRSTDRRSRDWWIGVAAVTLGAVPLIWFIFYYLAIAMNWGSYGE